MDLPHTILSIADNAKSYFGLHIDNVKLSAAEKLTIIISTMIMLAIGLVLGSVAMLFLIIGIILFLRQTDAPFWAYLIVAAGFVAAFLLIIMVKKPIIVNPTARFITKLIIKDPSDN